MIEQELKFIRNYIDFQKVRMPDLVSTHRDFRRGVKASADSSIVTFPLVENAYKYMGGDNWIKIKAHMNDKGLSFSVENSIPPFAQETKKNDFGIGLENLQRRLSLLYPDKFTLQIERMKYSFIAKLQIEW